MIILSHPTGNANVRAAALGLVNNHLLSGFKTCISTFPGDLLYHAGSLSPLSELRRRSYDSKLKPYTTNDPFREIGRIASLKFGIKKFVKHEAGVFCIGSVYQHLDKRVARSLAGAKKAGARAVYGYEDGALASFRQAQAIGLKCFYDLPIGYWRIAQFLLNKEKEKWPDWASTITGLKDSNEKLEKKDEEIRLADRIFVASNFTAKSLNDFPGDLPPVEVIPYGFPPVGKMRDYGYGKSPRPLRLLFVGGLSQRKGIADLFAAVKAIGPAVQLTVVGKKVGQDCMALDKELALHKYIPGLSNHDILLLMRESDVLVFPSLFEGFGLVITEAMSQGTPVITTERTAGPDLINNGENGWIIEAGSTEALKIAIEKILYNPASIAEAGKLALNTASRRPWEVYGKELASALQKQLL